MLYGEGNWLGTASNDSHVSVKELLRLQKAKTGSIQRHGWPLLRIREEYKMFCNILRLAWQGFKTQKQWF